MNSQSICLVVIFRDTLTLGLSQQASTRVLTVGQRTYVDQIDKRWYGFYDWLRDKQGHVLGVRFWRAVLPRGYDFQQICTRLSKFSYVEADDDDARCLDVYFSGRRDLDQHESGDADFEENRILVSADGEYAITYGLGWLEVENIERLKTFDVDWATAVWQDE